VLVVLPLAVFAVPALLGHATVVSDNFTQNYPLRVLVGSQIRHGHLPLFDPYIWSGAPLLGGWNAGAAYPFTLLFVILPGTAAWTLNLVVTWWVAGIGSFVFLRASRLAAVPSFLGALSFSFAGSMVAQIVHFGLVAGVSWVPVALLALLRLSECSTSRDASAEARRATLRSRLGWTALLCVAGAMAILAGEPRAISDFAVIVGIYALWRALRLGRNARPYLVYVAGGLLLSVALGAVQWLPGTAAVSTSQRGVSTTYLFTSGSLANKWLLLMLVPDLLGGSGSFGQPPFLASYNLTEVTGYIGLMPLVASFALLGRLRFRRPAPEWLIWQVMALVGILLALGGNTPLWHLLIRVPFFGGQRLQSRNILIADMGFAFLLAYWSDAWLAGARARRITRAAPVPAAGGASSAAGTAPAPSSAEAGSIYAWRVRILGVVPGLLAVATVAVGIAWGAGLLQWLGVSLRSATVDGGLRLWFLPFGVLGLGAVALILWGHRLEPRRRTQALVGFVIVDVGIFTLMAVVSLAPNLGSPSAGSISTAGSARAGAFPGASVPTPPTKISAAALTGSGRFAIYDPDLIDSNGLNVIGAPDLNIIRGVASVQGYSSIVDGTYASATGSHQSTGLGQDILDPGAVGDGTLDQLDTTALFAPRDYFLVSPESDLATPDPAAGERHLAPGGRATWYLGEDLAVTSVVVPDANATSDVGNGLRFGVLTSRGTTLWAPAVTLDGPHFLSVAFGRSVAAVALVAEAGRARAGLGSPCVTSEDGTQYVADGQLEAAVVPPRWAYRAQDGSFAVFADRFASPALTLRGSPGASVRATAGPTFAPSAAAVSSSHGVDVIRSEAAIPGWTATWHPDAGPALTLPIHRVGLVQGVEVPAGHGILTWTYDPPGWTAGWLFSACALVVLVILLVWTWAISRRDHLSRRRRVAPNEAHL
jgi:hypothetical protein